MTKPTPLSIRLSYETNKKLERSLELRNLELEKQGKSHISKSSLIKEAITFYYAYLTGDALDGQINALYESELNRAVRKQMQPVYSMMNRLNFMTSLNQNILKVIYNELNQWPDEDKLKKDYPLLFQIEKVVEECEKVKSE